MYEHYNCDCNCYTFADHYCITCITCSMRRIAGDSYSERWCDLFVDAFNRTERHNRCKRNSDSNDYNHIYSNRYSSIRMFEHSISNCNGKSVANDHKNTCSSFYLSGWIRIHHCFGRNFVHVVASDRIEWNDRCNSYSISISNYNLHHNRCGR